MNFHYSNSGIWYCIWFVVPILASVSIATKLQAKFTRQVGIILLPLLIIGTIVGGYLNYEYWGYPFRRPTVFSEIKDAKSINSITAIRRQSNEVRFSTYVDSTLTERLFGREDMYYGNLDRPIMAFLDRANMNGGLYDWYEISIDPDKKTTDSELSQISNLLTKSKLLIEPNQSYEESGNRFTGRVIDFRTTNGQEYYHATLKSGEVSNDHYPLYEVLMRKSGASIEIVKSQHFYTDFAGVEGMEYANIASFFEAIALLCLGLIVLIVNGIRLILEKKKSYNTTS